MSEIEVSICNFFFSLINIHRIQTIYNIENILNTKYAPRYTNMLAAYKIYETGSHITKQPIREVIIYIMIYFKFISLILRVL